MTISVLDLSHHNQQLDFAEMKKAQVYGIVHKASQGINFIDRDYRTREILCAVHGLQWGGYHFGDGSDPVKQAKFFISVVQPLPDTLLALDWEALSMGIKKAEIFVQTIYDLTGRWVLLYGGWWLKWQTNRVKSTLLTNCDLWIAQYGARRPTLPWKWKAYTLWQYGNLPRIKNCGRLDRNRFEGTWEQMKGVWNAV